MIGRSAHGCFGSKHSPLLGTADWSDFQDAPSLAVAPPSLLLIGHGRFRRAGICAPHIRLPLAAAGFANNRANGAKEPGAGGGAGWGAGRAEVTAGEARLDLPASFPRVGPSGGGSPPPPARRRGAEPGSGEATLPAGVALARAARSRVGG